MKTPDKATPSRMIAKAYNLYNHISSTESIAAGPLHSKRMTPPPQRFLQSTTPITPNLFGSTLNPTSKLIIFIFFYYPHYQPNFTHINYGKLDDNTKNGREVRH